MFDIGLQELIIIFVVALLVIGPEKLPEFSRKLGKWVNEIKKGVQIAKTSMEAEYKEQLSVPENSMKSDAEEGKADEKDIVPEAKEGKA
ncbi:MAG: Sec-independent protein translocase protein TatB [Nitrospirota bacterium]|nr:Sec-independent protein translocase protein TatB [Nitrospirota bacterium]